MNINKILKLRFHSQFSHRFISVLSETASKFNGYELSPGQKSLQLMARKFAREEVLPKAAEIDRTGRYPVELFRKAFELGLVNRTIPVKYGGAGLSLFDSNLVNEEISYACPSIGSSFCTNTLAQTPIIIGGSEELKKEYLGRSTKEPIACAYCQTEPGAGSDVSNIKTRAEKKGDKYILNGDKMWISNGRIANWYVVLARSNPDPKCPIGKALTSLVVDADTQGITKGSKLWNMGQRASEVVAVSFKDVQVPINNVIAEEGAGFKIAMKTLDKLRPGNAAGATGLIQRCLDESTKYSLERKTFGVDIAQHQLVQFMLAEMAIGLELSRMAWMRATWLADQDVKNTYFASIAKCFAADAANKAANDAVQIFGANGYNSAYHVEKLMRDAKLFQIYEGTSQIQRIIISREHFKKFQ